MTMDVYIATVPPYARSTWFYCGCVVYFCIQNKLYRRQKTAVPDSREYSRRYQIQL